MSWPASDSPELATTHTAAMRARRVQGHHSFSGARHQLMTVLEPSDAPLTTTRSWPLARCPAGERN
jgi:hypothetical protein